MGWKTGVWNHWPRGEELPDFSKMVVRRKKVKTQFGFRFDYEVKWLESRNHIAERSEVCEHGPYP